MKKYILFYGLLTFSLLMLFQLSSMTIALTGVSKEWLIALVALVSLGFGILFTRPSKSNTSEVTSSLVVPLKSYTEMGLTEREYEVLCLLDHGLSNKEVGDNLFISENTVKTHVSNLLVKLDAKRRTQAVKNAKQLNIIS